MAYSPDYRELIVSKLNEGATYRALERDYKLSRTTILKWKKDISRKLRIAKPTKIDNEKLKEDVALYPDDYQYERAVRFSCSQRAIGIALKRIGISQKKDLNSPTS
jgi:transposase